MGAEVSKLRFNTLAVEFAARGVSFSIPLIEGDGFRGFVIEDIDGYGLYFGCGRE